MLELFVYPMLISIHKYTGENPSRNGVVSRSDNKEPAEEEGARPLANGLFIELIPTV